MDNQSGGDDNDGEYNFDDIGLSDDEELIPGSDLSILEECVKENGEEDNSCNSDKEVDDENEHSVIEVEAPKDGMKFDTLKDLHKHLCDYAKQCAFSVRLRNVKPPRKTNMPPKHIIWVCHKGREQLSRSTNKMKPRPSQMTNCGAHYMGLFLVLCFGNLLLLFEQENIPKKRKNRKTATAQDEMASDEDDLFSGPSASVAKCDPTTHFSDAIYHPGEYTRMLQYFEQGGQ